MSEQNLYVNLEEFNKMVRYLVENYGDFYNATINISKGKQIKVQPYEGKIEIMCNDKEIKKILEKTIENE